MRDYFAAAGYEILDADQLKVWMDARIADGKISVVVFCKDIAPETVCETNTADCTLRKYLDAGGKIVLHSDIPFWSQANRGGDTTKWKDSGAIGILGFSAVGPGSIRNSYNIVQITEAGFKWGLTETWESRRPADAGVAADENLTVLATDDAGHAAAWVKHYVTDDTTRGFIRVLDTNTTPRPNFDDLKSLAEYGLVSDLARNPSPNNGATVDLSDATPLSWTAGEYAVKHDVYFGAAFDDVNDADATNTTGIYRDRQSLPIYTPAEALELGKTYYWRVDEVNAPPDYDIHNGKVWSFTITEYLLVDDFEGYTDYAPNDIFSSWLDGYNIDENGALVGYDNPNFDADEHFLETEIVQGGNQSLPFYYSNVGPATYSEATHTLTDTRDWTQQGVKALSLWFRGFSPFLGGFTEAPAGTFTMSAEGANIENESDEFHFVYKVLNGAGSITAKVESVENTHPWAKAGVMIRDSLDADSAHAMVAVTPGNGIWFGRRTATGNDTDTEEQGGITAPYWVRLERTLGGAVRAFYSADGNMWDQLGALTPVTMGIPMYAGLALTSHEPGVKCEAVFSNVTSDGTGTWANQDIGLTSNEAEPMYVSISNNNGTTGTVYYDDNQNIDPNVTLIDTWTEWNIDLKDFLDQGVNLSDVDSITIGIGDKNDPQPGGSGKMFFDDISLYQPRYVPGKAAPLRADFTGDGIVDDDDLEIMLNDWLEGDFTRQGPLLVHYKLDEGAGTVAADSSSQDSNGTFSGTAIWTAEGKMGAAASFDGGVGEIRGNSPYLNGLDAMSFGAWIKSNAVDTDAGFIIFENPAGKDQRSIRYDSAGGDGGGTNVMKYGVATEEGSYEIESSVNIQITQWQHVMVTWTSGEATKLYVNGVLDTPSSTDDIIGGTTIGYTDVIVGRGGKDADGSWDGLVDDVRVYEVALTAQQVQTVMNGGDIPVVDVYVPLTSPANIYDEEPVNSKQVNENDRAILDEEWLQESFWPEW